MKTKLLYTHIYAFLSMLFWGVSYVWTTIVFKYYSPVTTVFLRLLISTIILFLFIIIFNKIEKIKRKDIGILLLSALFNPFLYFLGESYGIKYTSPTISAVIIATIPLFTPIAAYYTIKERITSLNIFGIIISFAGILLILLKKDMSFRASPIGVLCLFGGVLAAIFYTALLKKLTKSYSPLIIITYQNFIGIFYFLPLFLIFEWNDFIQVVPNMELIFSLLQLAIFASSFAFIFYTIAIKNLGMSRTNVYSNLIPIFAAITSYFVLSEYFDLNKILGMIIVISGLLLSQIRRIKIYRKSSKKSLKL